jgi:hypothetical protein
MTGRDAWYEACVEAAGRRQGFHKSRWHAENVRRSVDDYEGSVGRDVCRLGKVLQVSSGLRPALAHALELEQTITPR